MHGSRSVMFHSSFVFDSVWLNAVAFATLALGPDMDVRFGARPHALIRVSCFLQVLGSAVLFGASFLLGVAIVRTTLRVTGLRFRFPRCRRS